MLFRSPSEPLLQDAITKRIKEGYTGKRAVRSDAVRYLKIILSGSHDQMKKIEASGEIKKWTNDSLRWIGEQFGNENVVKASLHMDEKTPHLHIVVVPLTKEGKLSAKTILRSPKIYKQLHTSYANKVGIKYGLKRGEERKPGEQKTPVTTLNEFYDSINRADESRNIKFDMPQIEKPNGLDLVKLTSWTAEQNQKIQEQLRSEIQRIQRDLDKKSFKTAAEIIREKKFKEDVEIKQNMLSIIKQEEVKSENLNGELLKLKKQYGDIQQSNKQNKEHLRNVLEGRYSKEKIRQLARQLNARLINDKNKGLSM